MGTPGDIGAMMRGGMAIAIGTSVQAIRTTMAAIGMRAHGGRSFPASTSTSDRPAAPARKLREAPPRLARMDQPHGFVALEEVEKNAQCLAARGLEFGIARQSE